ncbi:MAG: thioredoxin TrxC [Nitrosospira sp.]
MSDSLHLVCPHCHAVNRVPAARLGQKPNCGQCHQPLFTSQPVELTAVTFVKHLERSDIPILIDFWAPWCGPCKIMGPAFAQAAGMLEPQVRLAKVNTEAEPALGAQYSIRSIPTLALFREGREVARQAGVMTAQDIMRWVRSR